MRGSVAVSTRLFYVSQAPKEVIKVVAYDATVTAARGALTTRAAAATDLSLFLHTVNAESPALPATV